MGSPPSFLGGKHSRWGIEPKLHNRDHPWGGFVPVECRSLRPRTHPRAPGPRSHLVDTLSASLWVLFLSATSIPADGCPFRFPEKPSRPPACHLHDPGDVSPASPSPSVCRAGAKSQRRRQAAWHARTLMAHTTRHPSSSRAQPLLRCP